MLEGRIVTALVILGIFVTAVAIALIYFGPGSRTLPLVIGIPGIILSSIQLVAELRDKDPKKISLETRRGEIGMVIWFAVFAAGIVLFGFIYGGPVLIAAYLLISAKEKWYTALAGAALAFVLLRYVFQETIGLVLFEGLIPPMFIPY